MSSVNGQAKAGAPAQDILRMEHITKIYGNGFIANNGIDFSVRKGEIHALAGENGAGKSTLRRQRKGASFIKGKKYISQVLSRLLKWVSAWCISTLCSCRP